jgi:hypothetical protein
MAENSLRWNNLKKPKKFIIAVNNLKWNNVQKPKKHKIIKNFDNNHR